jgi:N utilization substance protein A
LFESEIPEVYDGTVVIKNAVREGGERAKVAVASNDDSVDPVGACVGMKGSRISAIIRELRGEKIDIIKFSSDIVEYTINALNPARISKVLISGPDEKTLEVIVPEDQLSLAIGRKGQNVRLASKLLGWEIDIKSAEEKKAEVREQIDQLDESTSVSPVSLLVGIGDALRAKLDEAGIESVEDLASKSEEELTEIPGIGSKTAQKLLSLSQAFLESAEGGAEPDVSTPVQESVSLAEEVPE